MVFNKAQYNKLLQYMKDTDSIIYNIIKKHGYLKPTPKRNIYALLIGSIIGQKIKFSLARKLRGQLYVKLGTDDFYPKNVNNLTLDDFENIGLSELQIGIIERVTKYITENKLDIKKPTDIKQLLDVKGIGKWTINCTNIMYNLNANDNDFDDEILYQDLIIKRGIKKLYKLTDNSSIVDLSKKWSPYRGLVTWYLWKEFT
jgi:DNA-3-methyladenine glycosylase II